MGPIQGPLSMTTGGTDGGHGCKAGPDRAHAMPADGPMQGLRGAMLAYGRDYAGQGEPSAIIMPEVIQVGPNGPNLNHLSLTCWV